MTTCLKRVLVKCWLASTGNKSHSRAGQTCSRGRGVAVKKEMFAVPDIKSRVELISQMVRIFAKKRHAVQNIWK